MTLTAAMSTPDTDVPVPPRQQATSLTSQIAALDVGESVAKLKRIDGDITMAEYAEQGTTWRESLRDNASSSMRAAKARTGGTYEIEVADLTTTGRNVFLVAIVTRTA